jgi:hypothetical protein
MSVATKPDTPKNVIEMQLDDIISDKNMMLQFREFLKSIYCNENLAFWLEAETFKQVPDSNVAKKAQELFNKYFDASSDHAVNIEDAELQRELMEAMKKPTRETFTNVQNAIWGLLKFECFPRFKSSPFFSTPLNKKQKEALKRSTTASHLDQYLKGKKKGDKPGKKPRESELPLEEKRDDHVPEFEEVFEDKELMLGFREFLYRRFANENLAFYFEVELYKFVTDKAEQKKRAKEVYEKYCTSESLYAVNLDWNIQSRIKNNIENPNEDIFNSAQAQIYKCLKNEWFPEFCTSELLQQCNDEAIVFEKSKPGRERGNTVDGYERLQELRAAVKQNKSPENGSPRTSPSSPQRENGYEADSSDEDTKSPKKDGTQSPKQESSTVH